MPPQNRVWFPAAPGFLKWLGNWGILLPVDLSLPCWLALAQNLWKLSIGTATISDRTRDAHKKPKLIENNRATLIWSLNSNTQPWLIAVFVSDSSTNSIQDLEVMRWKKNQFPRLRNPDVCECQDREGWGWSLCHGCVALKGNVEYQDGDCHLSGRTSNYQFWAAVLCARNSWCILCDIFFALCEITQSRDWTNQGRCRERMPSSNQEFFQLQIRTNEQTWMLVNALSVRTT